MSVRLMSVAVFDAAAPSPVPGLGYQSYWHKVQLNVVLLCP